MMDSKKQLSETEIKRRRKNLNFAIANNELSGYVVSDVEKLNLERYVLGEVTLSEILTKWKNEDETLITKLMLNYPVTLVSDDGGVMATFVDVPEAITFGADEEEALLQASDALVAGLSFYVDDRKLLPNPSKPKRGQKTVSPAKALIAKFQAIAATDKDSTCTRID